jgi:hypothetical protein
MLVLDMIEILPPLGKYKYETWRILLVKCYIDNFVPLPSCIRNVNKHFWRRCWGGSQYLLSVYISASLCLCLVFAVRCMTGFDLLAN